MDRASAFEAAGRGFDSLRARQIRFTVSIAQSVEHWTVDPGVKGSSPFTHPQFSKLRPRSAPVAQLAGGSGAITGPRTRLGPGQGTMKVRARSSAGQSSGLLSRGSGVRVPPGAPAQMRSARRRSRMRLRRSAQGSGGRSVTETVAGRNRSCEAPPARRPGGSSPSGREHRGATRGERALTAPRGVANYAHPRPSRDDNRARSSTGRAMDS